MAKKIESVKAWAILAANGRINCVLMNKPVAKYYTDLGRTVITVLIVPITPKRRKKK
jgi:hypothetical protein